jgi:hypothetical protein
MPPTGIADLTHSVLLQPERQASQADLDDPRYAKLRHHPGGLRAILTASTLKRARVGKSSSAVRPDATCNTRGLRHLFTALQAAWTIVRHLHQ